MATRSESENDAVETAAWPEGRPAYTSLAAAVQGEAARWNVPGVAVAVYHEGELIEASAGVTSIATKVPLQPHAVFQIGSISKVFATTLALTLVDEGKLDLDEPVITYVPELPLADAEARKTITMRHLLSHSSGLEGDRFGDYGRGDDALDKAIARFDILEQWFRPGEAFAYCNTGFYLVGLITNRLTGKSWEAALQERVLDPWGLSETVLFAEDAITRHHAVGHFLPSREAGLVIARPYWNRRHATPAGGVLSTVGDLVTFAQAHLNGGELNGARVLKAETAQLMQTPFIKAGVNRHYGQGWSIETHDGVAQIGHGGATDGFRANLTAIPEKGFVIAQLTNADPGRTAMEQIEAWALEHYLGITHPKAPIVPADASRLDAIAGVYTRHSMRTTLTAAGDHLAADVTLLDPDSGEEGGQRTFAAYPIDAGDEWVYRVDSGEFAGLTMEFLDLPTADDPNRLLLRLAGRVAAKEPAPKKPRRRTTKKATDA